MFVQVELLNYVGHHMFTPTVTLFQMSYRKVLICVILPTTVQQPHANPFSAHIFNVSNIFVTE